MTNYNTEEWEEELKAAMALGRVSERQDMACQVMTPCQRKAILEALHHCPDQNTINRLYANFKDVIESKGAEF